MKHGPSILLALVAVVHPTFAAGGDDAVLSVERPGTGEPVCGLGRDFHSGRRAALRERVEKGLLFFRGLPETRDYLRFHQDKLFWYLTGIETPGAALLMDAKSGREVLFLPRPNRNKERWEGEQWDTEDEWIGPLVGIDEILPTDDLEDTLRQWLKKEKTVWIATRPAVALSGCLDRAEPFNRHRERDPFDGRPSREQVLATTLEKEFKARVKDASPHVEEMRRVKTPREIAAMRRAARAGALAMSEAMRSTRPGIGEWELESLMTFVMVRSGAVGPAYHGIVGSGPNSNVLHYSASARALNSGEVVLIDYGPELDHYTTDITRTWPVDGQFTPRMTEMYDAVLAAQTAGIDAVKPGATLGEINAVCSKVLRERGFGKYTLHGACHYIGLEVHDVGDGSAAFEPGVAFTVEPGIYDPESGIGVRIEDVVVVTEEGCEVLSRDVPKDRESIQRLVAREGVLDWLLEGDQ